MFCGDKKRNQAIVRAPYLFTCLCSIFIATPAERFYYTTSENARGSKHSNDSFFQGNF